MKSDRLFQGLKRISSLGRRVISFESLEWITSWVPAIWGATEFSALRQASHIPISTATLRRLQHIATNRERLEKTSTGNRLSILSTWIASLIVWLIVVGVSLAIVAVALLCTE